MLDVKKKKTLAIRNLHCGCAFCCQRGCRVSLKWCSSHTTQQTQRVASTETHIYIDPTLRWSKRRTHEAISLIPTLSPNGHVLLLLFFSFPPLPVLSVDRHSHMIKDCPLPAWHCWLKWSRSNYCNKGENVLGCMLKRNPYTSAEEGDCSLNIRLTVPLWQ